MNRVNRGCMGGNEIDCVKAYFGAEYDIDELAVA